MTSGNTNVPHGGEFDPFHHGDDWLDEDPNDPFVGHYTDATGCHPIRQSEMADPNHPVNKSRDRWRQTPKVAYVDRRTTEADVQELLETNGRDTTKVVFCEPKADDSDMHAPTVLMEASMISAKTHRDMSGRDERPPDFSDGSSVIAEDRAAERDTRPVSEVLSDLGADAMSRLTELASDTAASAAERAKMLGKAAQELAERWLGTDDSEKSDDDDTAPPGGRSDAAAGPARPKRPLSSSGTAGGTAARGNAPHRDGPAPGRSRWDGRLATTSDGRVNLHETIFRHLMQEFGPDAPPNRGSRRSHRRGPGSDGRERYVGTEREGIAPGLGFMRSFAAARGLDMDSNGQFVGYEDLQKGAPAMQMITTHLSSYGAKAATDPKLYGSPIALNLPDIAPLLLSWLEGVSAEAVPGKPSRWGRTEIEQTLEREVMMLTGKFGPIGEVTQQQRAKAKVWEQVLDGNCQSVPVQLVPDLIRSCDITAMAHDHCGHQGGTEHHQDGHRQMSASWRCLAAYLAARLDAVGRHMSPALMFARD